MVDTDAWKNSKAVCKGRDLLAPQKHCNNYQKSIWICQEQISVFNIDLAEGACCRPHQTKNFIWQGPEENLFCHGLHSLKYPAT